MMRSPAVAAAVRGLLPPKGEAEGVGGGPLSSWLLKRCSNAAAPTAGDAGATCSCSGGGGGGGGGCWAGGWCCEPPPPGGPGTGMGEAGGGRGGSVEPPPLRLLPRLLPWLLLLPSPGSAQRPAAPGECSAGGEATGGRGAAFSGSSGAPPAGLQALDSALGVAIVNSTAIGCKRSQKPGLSLHTSAIARTSAQFQHRT